MKVFDFTDGKKGKLLAETQIINSNGSWFKPNTEEPWKIGSITFADSATQWDYDKKKDKHLLATQFGVEAICFCTGQDSISKEWDWMFIATDDWINRQLGIVIKSSLNELI